MRERARYSFQGCVIAFMPIIVSILIGIATYYTIKSMFPMPVVVVTVFNVTWGAWAMLYILKKKLGE